MRAVAINEAEAIIEPFWTGDKNADDSVYDVFEGYRIAADPEARASHSPTAWFTIEKAVPGRPAMTLEKSGCDVDVRDYDASRLFACIPRHYAIRLHAGFDGGAPRPVLEARGTDTLSEFTGSLPGGRLTALRIEMVPHEDKPAIIELVWVGVVHRERERRMEARPSPYTPDWPGRLVAEPAGVQPRLGLFFGAEETEELRRRLRRPPLSRMLDALREQTDRDLKTFRPEAAVGQFLPDPFQSVFVRERDRRKPAMHDGMGRLAFVGLIDRDPAKSRLAVRMALAAAHCPDWTQGVLSVLPGSPYHRRGYVEAWYCKGMAMVLDWAADYLTPYGRETLRDVLIRQALAHIESDLMRWEYVWGMNQGLMFNHGRLMALLAVHQTYPRYRARLLEAERDQHTMLEAYVTPDGGTLEGMGYWQAALEVGLPPLCAMARLHGQPVEAYATDTLRRTGDFALDMLSIQAHAGGRRFLPVNSIMADTGVHPFVAAFFARVSKRPEWLAAWRESVETARAPDVFALLLAGGLDADATAKGGVPVRPRLGVYPGVGQVTCIRDAPGAGLVHFHFCTGPGKGGHTHEDKGSFLIETAHGTLAMDRGMLHYDHPEHLLLGRSGRHNLFCPEDADGLAVRQHPSTTEGGILRSALQADGVLLLASDQSRTWAPGTVLSSLRRVISPDASLYLIADELETAEELTASFRINTAWPIEARGRAWRIRGPRTDLLVVPLDWTPAGVTTVAEGVDDRAAPVNLLRLLAAPARRHRVTTALEILPAGQGRPAWSFTCEAGRIVARRGPAALTVEIGASPALRVTWSRPGVAPVEAVCDDDWTLEPRAESVP